MKFKIKNASFVKVILLIVTLGGFFISTLNLSNFIYYIADILNVILLIFSINKIRKKMNIANFKILYLNIVIFILITIIGIILNNVSIIEFSWGIRNVYRYFIFMISCIVLLKPGDVESIINLILKLFWINLAFTLVEYFIFKIRGDFLGGIFGIAKGCNGMTSIFINVVIAIIISNYLSKNISLRKTCIYVLAYFTITALAEIKANFIFFIVLVIIALMVAKKNRRIIILGIVALLSVFIGINLLQIYFPNSVKYLLDMNKANSYMDASYFEHTTFTRNSSLKVANRYFFKENKELYMFGYGIGACDTSRFFSSDFYKTYGDMNYRQYGVAMMVLQNGYLGLISYFMFFILSAYYVLKNNNSINNKNRAYISMIVSTAVFSIIYSFYASLLIDSSYFIYFIMAIPYIILKNRNDVLDLQVKNNTEVLECKI